MFFHDQLSLAAQASVPSANPGGSGNEASSDEAEDSVGPAPGPAFPHGPVVIACMTFVANVVSCSSYREDVLTKVLTSLYVRVCVCVCLRIFSRSRARWMIR